nr:unnamed protein product [Digitaria exilis]
MVAPAAGGSRSRGGGWVAFEDGSTTSYALLNAQERVVLDEALSYSLDDCIEFIQEDELVEVTPASIRMSKNPKISKKK